MLSSTLRLLAASVLALTACDTAKSGGSINQVQKKPAAEPTEPAPTGKVDKSGADERTKISEDDRDRG